MAQQSRDTENVPDQSCVGSCGVISVTVFVLLQLFETLSLHFMGKMKNLGSCCPKDVFSLPWDPAELSLFFPPSLICFEAFPKGGSSPCLKVRRCMDVACGLRRWEEL